MGKQAAQGHTEAVLDGGGGVQCRFNQVERCEDISKDVLREDSPEFTEVYIDE